MFLIKVLKKAKHFPIIKIELSVLNFDEKKPYENKF